MDQFERNYIDGEWVAPASAQTLKVHNPSTKEFITTTPDSDARDVDRAVAAARAAQPAWERLPAIQRAGHIRAVAAKLREHKARLARRISLEQGKILPLAEVEIDFTANYMDYMSEWARRIDTREVACIAVGPQMTSPECRTLNCGPTSRPFSLSSPSADVWPLCSGTGCE